LNENEIDNNLHLFYNSKNPEDTKLVKEKIDFLLEKVEKNENLTLKEIKYVFS